MKVGVDASPLIEKRTGVGNYVFSILSSMIEQRPSWQFFLYSNRTIHGLKSPNVVLHEATPFRRDPIWQNTQLRRHLRVEKPDIFWGTNGYLPLGLPRTIKTIVTIHDLVYRRVGHTMPTLTRFSRKFFQPIAVRKADRVVAVSHATADEINAVYGKKVDAVVHPVVDHGYRRATLEVQENIRAKFSLPDRFLLVIGTLEPRKNLAALLKAWLAVSDSHASLPLLAVAGGKGWLDSEISALLAHGERKGQVMRLGFVEQEDMAALYSAAEAFLLPSVYEGFGMPVVEAQLCGIPVMISEIPSLLEASGGVAATFLPSKIGIEQALVAYVDGRLPLVCRLPSLIENNAASAAEVMIRQMEIIA